MCLFRGNLFSTKSAALVWGLCLAENGRWVRLGHVDTMSRQMFYLCLVLGVPGAGGSCPELCSHHPCCYQEVQRGGTTGIGVVFKIHELALLPCKCMLARAFPFSWKEVVWAVVSKCCRSILLGCSCPGFIRASDLHITCEMCRPRTRT